MIFVTIGSMFPFDRLIRVMDDWVAKTGETDLLAQIGNGEYEPVNMPFVRRLSRVDFTRRMSEADVIVAHAGMGTVITAGQIGRPLAILPRIKDWGEHTTDHQLATAKWLRDKPGIFVADTDEDLPRAIETARLAGAGEARFAAVADKAFTDRLRAEILGSEDE